jgi:hypothetical protein
MSRKHSAFTVALQLSIAFRGGMSMRVSCTLRLNFAQLIDRAQTGEAPRVMAGMAVPALKGRSVICRFETF